MKRSMLILFSLLILASMVLAACGPAVPAATEEVMEESSAAPEPTAEPEVVANPLGSPENPIIMALAPSATTQELLASGEDIARQLSEATGYSITTVVPTSYGALVEAMGAGQAHVGWLPPFAYVIAHEKGFADVGLVTIRRGATTYGAQFVANVAGGFTSYFDASANDGAGANTADAATALAQFEGLKPCWTDPLSSSGYVIPLGILQNAGVKARTGAFVQGHPTVINSIYLSANGEICNFGATFVDARSGVAEQFPDVNDKVVVIWRTDPTIPNDNVSFAADLPEDVRAKIAEALLAIAETEAGKAALKSVYSIDGLQVVDDTFYDDFRVYLEASGVDVTSLVR